MAKLLFKRVRGGRVLVPEDVVLLLNQHRQLKRNAQEAGGILLGRLVQGTDDAIIDSITQPGTDDERRRFFFRRGVRRAQETVNDAWLRSEGSVNYLGEWHTHPEGDPSPSSIDVTNWEIITKEARYDSGFLVFIIVGTQAIRAWECSVQWKTPIEMEWITEAGI